MRTFFALLFSILALTACNQPDKALIAKMQENLLSIQAAYAPYAVTGKSLVALQEQIKNAPLVTDANADAGPYSEMTESVRLLLEKHRSISEQYNDMQIKLQSSVADYTAGKITKEPALRSNY